jgi:hypothetical protein
VRIWTAHEKPHTSPLLVREGFSLGALLFGPLWLAAHRAWIPAAGSFLLTILFLLLVHPPVSIVLVLGLALLLGFSGRDLVRWSIARRGYLESSIVSGRNEDEALDRLLSGRPDLLERTMAAEGPP